MKKIISMSLMVVVIVALGVMYFIQTRPEPLSPSLENEDTIVAEAVNLRLIERQEEDVLSIAFITEEETHGMFSIPNEAGGVMWRWADNYEYLLDPARAREKARPAWQLTAIHQLHENSYHLDLSEFGLDPPLTTIMVAYADGTFTNIYLGGTTTDLRHNFIMVGDDPAIYTIVSVIAQRMQGTLKDILDRTPIAFAGAAHYIKIVQPGRRTVELAIIDSTDNNDDFFMAGTGLLAMLQPFPGRGVSLHGLNVNILEPFGADFRIGDVVAVSPNDLSQFGLDKPSLEFIYHSDFGELHLMFGSVFQDENGTQIYVKMADRPHVFQADFAPIIYLIDINLFQLVDRFITLINILDVNSITIDSNDPMRQFDLQINHAEAGTTNAISPTVNGIDVPEAAFRRAYQLLIALAGDAPIEQFSPNEEPEFTVTYHRNDGVGTTVVRFFNHDANFLAVSLDDEDPWFITNRRSVELMFAELQGLIN